MTLQEFEKKRDEYNEISDTKYSMDRLSRKINDFKQDNPNTDYDASNLSKLFLELSLRKGFNISVFKKGVCYMADIVLDYEKKKYEEMVANFEKKKNNETNIIQRQQLHIHHSVCAERDKDNDTESGD